MTHSVRHHLRLDIADYDASIRRFIPGYERMLREAADHAAAVSPAMVLDLGAGTGALAAALLERPGVGTVRLVDVDDEMLALARVRLAGAGARAQFERASYFDELPPCGAVTASLALHHIPTIEKKRRVYERIFAALRPGGVFVSADANMPADAHERTELYRFWIDHMEQNGITESQARRHLEDWAGEDTYLPLDEELAALHEAGFDARSTWRMGPIGVVCARRPPGSRPSTT